MSYIFNDGGRAEAGYKGTAGDCGARAMAIALGISYKDAYKEIAQVNKDMGFAKSARNGIIIARQARHFVAVKDGVPHDIWNCTNKMVYGYWAKT